MYNQIMYVHILPPAIQSRFFDDFLLLTCLPLVTILFHGSYVRSCFFDDWLLDLEIIIIYVPTYAGKL